MVDEPGRSSDSCGLIESRFSFDMSQHVSLCTQKGRIQLRRSQALTMHRSAPEYHRRLATTHACALARAACAVYACCYQSSHTSASQQC